MQRDFLIFCKKSALFLLIIAVLDFSLGNLLEYLYFKSGRKSSEFHLTYSLEQADQEVLVFGSSRAQHHYIPNFFTSSNRTFYNTGEDGQGIFYAYIILKNVLERSHKTKTIILDLQPNEFNNDDGAYDRLAELLPYYHRNKFVRKLLNEIDPYESVKTLSYLYRYNSKLLSILEDTFIPSPAPIQNGFEPIEVSLDKTLELTDYDHQDILDFKEIETFKRFLKEAKKNHHKVYVLVSPVFRDYSHGTPETIQIAQKICRDNDVPFYTYHRDTSFLRQPDLFSDPSHLNEKGAEMYSKKVAALIMENTNTNTHKNN
ncbi:hypothetical protein [Negadavirga shengliensis]|uniref:GDSL-like lipase/acylhydrolase family protein n=1 Tax=Negadavirga shengliensis TaxID=1389218 RepID=A0ABV9T2E7_9BACT